MTITQESYFQELNPFALINKTYYQIDSREDAPYYQNFFSIDDLRIISYVEGDINIIKTTNENELKSELIRIINWMIGRKMFLGIDATLEKDKRDKLYYLGLEKFIH